MPVRPPRVRRVAAVLAAVVPAVVCTACSGGPSGPAATVSRAALATPLTSSSPAGPGTAPATTVPAAVTTSPAASPSSSGTKRPAAAASTSARPRPSRYNEPGRFTVAPVRRGRTLAGRVIVLDPGHQIGNGRHLAQVNRLVSAGAGVRKECNTTGTSTNAGYPESRFAMKVALATRKRLESLGATVVLTRPREDLGLWGPCIDARGKVGNTVHADAVVSIHADGAPASARGFHVIRPAGTAGWTDDIAGSSRRLAVAVHAALLDAGERPATYIGSRDGYDVRSDLGTLNWSDRPIVMVEMGNMRSSADAGLLTDPRWQDGVAAAAITAGVVDFLS